MLHTIFSFITLCKPIFTSHEKTKGWSHGANVYTMLQPTCIASTLTARQFEYKDLKLLMVMVRFKC